MREIQENDIILFRREELVAAMERAMDTADVLVLSGGVSMGEKVSFVYILFILFVLFSGFAQVHSGQPFPHDNPFWACFHEAGSADNICGWHWAGWAHKVGVWPSRQSGLRLRHGPSLSDAPIASNCRHGFGLAQSTDSC
jgi:hypothetical protein